MGYQKFSDRPQRHHQTLGALGGLGDHDPERAKSPEPQIVTLAPPKVPKPPKVDPTSEIECQALGRPSSETWTDAQKERATSVAEALARLDPNNPPHDVPLDRWQRFIEDCECFRRLGWANLAEAYGWGPLDLFGCDRERPLARYDHMGLLWILHGRKLVALTAQTATIDTLTGSLQTYPRRPIKTDRVILPWNLSA
jgi:hypothetical protein